MKELNFDQYEFDGWESEQSLRIVLQDKLIRGISYETLERFLEKAWHNAEWCGHVLPPRPPATPFSELPLGDFLPYLQHFASIEAQPSWSYYVYDDDWNYQMILISSPARHILYQWMTSA